MNKWDSIGLKQSQKSRLKHKSIKDISSALKVVFQSILSSKRGIGTLSDGSLPGPFNAWMYTDLEMAEKLDNIGIAIRENTNSVPDQMKEIVICCIAVHFRCNVEFWAHSKIAISKGVPKHIIDSIFNNEIPKFEKNPNGKKIEIAYQLSNEYLTNYRISNDLYEKLILEIGSEKGLVELVLVMSHYIGLATQLNVFRVPCPGNIQYFK